MGIAAIFCLAAARCRDQVQLLGGSLRHGKDAMTVIDVKVGVNASMRRDACHCLPTKTPEPRYPPGPVILTRPPISPTTPAVPLKNDPVMSMFRPATVPGRIPLKLRRSAKN